MNTWISLGFLVLMLTMILLLKGQVANSAAGCFSRISAPPEEEQIVLPVAPEESGNVRVLILPKDVLIPDVTVKSPDGGATIPE
jgi:hypothetical protein